MKKTGLHKGGNKGVRSHNFAAGTPCIFCIPLQLLDNQSIGDCQLWKTETLNRVASTVIGQLRIKNYQLDLGEV